MKKLTKESIMQMGRGAFMERADYEMDRVIDNILDVNTKATAKRKITITLELVPDEARQQIGVNVTAKSTLAVTNPATTTLFVTNDENGEMMVVEAVPQVPGQMAMDAPEQESPKILKLMKA